MTNEEIIRSVIDELKDGYIACGEQGHKLLQASLDKQIAKKPVLKQEQNLRYILAYECPRCGGGISGTGVAKYCYHCGQKLDWREVKE